jgi:hypothetical protein
VAGSHGDFDKATVGPSFATLFRIEFHDITAEHGTRIKLLKNRQGAPGCILPFETLLKRLARA